MKNTLLLISLAALLVGCSGGASDASAADSATAQSNFSRPMTDAEKAKGGGASPADGGVAPPAKQ